MAEGIGGNLHELLKSDPRRVYVIAAAGLNHGGSRERALTLVRAAKWAGADAVKFQTCRPGTATSSKADLSLEAFKALHKEAQRIGIDFLSTPVDEDSADFLNDLGVHGFNFDSGDMKRRPLIEYVSRKGKPVLLSIGISSIEEIDSAIEWVRTQSNDQIVLLQGVSSHPAKPEELNLKSLEFIRERFAVPVGFSDQSSGTLSSVVAVSLGAQVVERHFMIENRPDSPDQVVSMDTKQLKIHIEDLRKIGTMLGKSRPASSGSLLHVRRPSTPAKAIDADMVRPVRPLAGKQAAAAKATNAPA